MSRLTDLIHQVQKTDPQLAEALRAEYDALSERRAYGLNFERHTPETVDLPGRPIRRRDKVRFLPERDADKATIKALDKNIWRVTGFAGSGVERTALLARPSGNQSEESIHGERLVSDLVVVAEFRDPIYPGLRTTGKIERGGNKPFHTVINAENFHALEMLLYTHGGQVDAIYIDPPYNTGAKDWKYNNDYVEADDLYRHSKWLAFMERRLKLAQRLLNPANSVLVVTIENDGLIRDHCDGLIRDHLVRVAADDLALIERGSEAAGKCGQEWSCLSRSGGIVIARACRSGHSRSVIGLAVGRSGRRWSRRSRRRASDRRAVRRRSLVSSTG